MVTPERNPGMERISESFAAQAAIRGCRPTTGRRDPSRRGADTYTTPCNPETLSHGPEQEPARRTPGNYRRREMPEESPTGWTPELLMKVRDVTQVRVSPDGKRVVYCVADP